MSESQALLASIAAAAFVLALFAGWRDRRRRVRVHADAVGWVDWTTVQMAALIALAIAGWLALKG